jgi:uncharacterized BrkB/YihY/UPF0761 family membrane protein
LLLLLYIAATLSPAQIIEAAAAQAWYEQSPGLEIILGVRVILPLALFLFLVFSAMLKEKLRHRGEIFLGTGLTIVGM